MFDIVKYPNLERFDTLPDYGDRQYRNTSGVGEFFARRHKAYERKITGTDRLKAGLGAAIGTLIPLILLMKKQKVNNPFKLNYGLGDIVMLSASSITGGTFAGMIGEDKKTNHNKLKEALFQFMNASIPTWMSAGSLKLCENSKRFNNVPSKLISMLGSLIIGMYGAASVSNLIVDPKDKHPDRKLTLKDCLVNIDDVFGALILAKIPFLEKLHPERILPFIFAFCGYRSGKSN